jgi:hypothetical protein
MRTEFMMSGVNAAIVDLKFSIQSGFFLVSLLLFSCSDSIADELNPRNINILSDIISDIKLVPFQKQSDIFGQIIIRKNTIYLSQLNFDFSVELLKKFTDFDKKNAEKLYLTANSYVYKVMNSAEIHQKSNLLSPKTQKLNNINHVFSHAPKIWITLQSYTHIGKYPDFRPIEALRICFFEDMSWSNVDVLANGVVSCGAYRMPDALSP